MAMGLDSRHFQRDGKKGLKINRATPSREARVGLRCHVRRGAHEAQAAVEMTSVTLRTLREGLRGLRNADDDDEYENLMSRRTLLAPPDPLECGERTEERAARHVSPGGHE